MKANSLSDVKQANKRLLYQCIRQQKMVTMTELEYITRLSRPTVVGLVHEMEDEQSVIQMGFGTSNGGRAPKLYGINVRAAFAMGIDMEFPAIRMAISDLDGTPICTSIHYCPPNACKDDVLELLLLQIESLLSESGIDHTKLLGIGMGVPGIIDRKNNYSLLLERIRGWENVPIGQIIEQRFGFPVYIWNDVDLLAWAERRLAPEESYSEMLYIAIRYGIGMAVWMDGKLLQGEGGNLGRIGHMMVNIEGPQCKCGSRGCLGLYTGERAMCALYLEESGKQVFHARDILKLAEAGDAAALHTLETTGHYLGIGIVNVANLFDISNIVISASFDLSSLLEKAIPVLETRNTYTLRNRGNLHARIGRMGEEQYALGGCMMVLEQFHSPTGNQLNQL